MKRKAAYFARPITQFDVGQDAVDMAFIERAGFAVIDITDSATQDMYKKIGMGIFRPIVESANVLFFRAFDDGLIGAGVAAEIRWATERSIPVFEIPHNIEARRLSVKETRERVHPQRMDQDRRSRGQALWDEDQALAEAYENND